MHAVQLLEGHTASWGRGDGDDPWADLEQHGIHRRELNLTVPEKVLTPTQLAQGPTWGELGKHRARVPEAESLLLMQF